MIKNTIKFNIHSSVKQTFFVVLKSVDKGKVGGTW